MVLVTTPQTPLLARVSAAAPPAPGCPGSHRPRPLGRPPDLAQRGGGVRGLAMVPFSWACACPCVYMSMHVCIYIYIYTHMSISVYYICNKSVDLHICIHIYTHGMCGCLYLDYYYMYICIYVCICACVYLCLNRENMSKQPYKALFFSP